jgi:shikimate kinase
MNIFLVGFMGSGKTTIGKMLAKKLGLSFIDLDAAIEKQHGMSVGMIYSTLGECSLREIERDMLLDLTKNNNQVFSVGGGVACFFDNIELMNKNGLSIYLKLSIDTILGRLLSFPPEIRQARPLLANKTHKQVKNYIETTLVEREPFYNKAKVIIDCDKLNVDETLKKVEKSIIYNQIPNLTVR